MDRRLALNVFALLCFAAAMASSRPARAEELFVSALVSSNGDGSAANPYWRITDAVTRARADRNNAVVPPTETITIHIGPGVYSGSYSLSATNPRQELLPIVLNFPNVTLSGVTTLALDAYGLPAGVVTGSPQTILLTNDVMHDQHDQQKAYIVVCRTTDCGAGDNVTLSGITLDMGVAQLWGTGMIVERVFGFAIRGNLMQHGTSGVWTRRASGVIEGNLLLDNSFQGGLVTGGSKIYPATVTVRGNRFASTGAISPLTNKASLWGFFVAASVEHLQLRLGETGFSALPAQDTANGADVETGVDINVLGNEMSGNMCVGFVLDFWTFVQTSASVAANPSPFIAARVIGNRIIGNGELGLDVEAGNDVRHGQQSRYSGLFVGTFDQNLILGNRVAALFSFTTAEVPGGGTPVGFDYLQGATFTITDVDGEFAGFNFDNPLADPISGRTLNNTLTVNGTAYTGTNGGH